MKHPTKPDESPSNPHQSDERPTLTFTNAADDVRISIAFGYHDGEPTAALFHGDSLVLIPRDVLDIALNQGWSDDTVCECCVAEALSLVPETGEA